MFGAHQPSAFDCETVKRAPSAHRWSPDAAFQGVIANIYRCTKQTADPVCYAHRRFDVRLTVDGPFGLSGYHVVGGIADDEGDTGEYAIGDAVSGHIPQSSRLYSYWCGGVIWHVCGPMVIDQNSSYSERKHVDVETLFGDVKNAASGRV